MLSKPDGFLMVVTRIPHDTGSVGLTGMMLPTVADVILRVFGHPIPGTFEIAGLLPALAVGFAIPKVLYDRGRVFMEILPAACGVGICCFTGRRRKAGEPVIAGLPEVSGRTGLKAGSRI